MILRDFTQPMNDLEREEKGPVSVSLAFLVHQSDVLSTSCKNAYAPWKFVSCAPSFHYLQNFRRKVVVDL